MGVDPIVKNAATPLGWVMLEPRHVEAYLRLRPDMAGRIVSTEGAAASALDTVDELALTAPDAELIDRFPARRATCQSASLGHRSATCTGLAGTDPAREHSIAH